MAAGSLVGCGLGTGQFSAGSGTHDGGTQLDDQDTGTEADGE